MSSVSIHLDRSGLDLRLSLKAITPVAYVIELIDRVRAELPVLAPLSDAAVLSLFDRLPPEVLAANPFAPVA